MIERFLGEEVAGDIFYASMITGLMPEKDASDMELGFEKSAAVDPNTVLKYLNSAGSLAKNTIGKLYDAAVGAVKAVPPSLGITMLLGAGTGAIGTMAYDAIKERMSQEDPETKFYSDVEALYAGKKNEKDDSAWMDRVRAMRDDLKRNMKRMSTAEYAEKYKALEKALDERS